MSQNINLNDKFSKHLEEIFGGFGGTVPKKQESFNPSASIAENKQLKLNQKFTQNLQDIFGSVGKLEEEKDQENYQLGESLEEQSDITSFQFEESQLSKSIITTSKEPRRSRFLKNQEEESKDFTEDDQTSFNFESQEESKKDITNIDLQNQLAKAFSQESNTVHDDELQSKQPEGDEKESFIDEQDEEQQRKKLKQIFVQPEKKEDEKPKEEEQQQQQESEMKSEISQNIQLDQTESDKSEESSYYSDQSDSKTQKQEESVKPEEQSLAVVEEQPVIVKEEFPEKIEQEESLKVQEQKEEEQETSNQQITEPQEQIIEPQKIESQKIEPQEESIVLQEERIEPQEEIIEPQQERIESQEIIIKSSSEESYSEESSVQEVLKEEQKPQVVEIKYLEQKQEQASLIEIDEQDKQEGDENFKNVDEFRLIELPQVINQIPEKQKEVEKPRIFNPAPPLESAFTKYVQLPQLQINNEWIAPKENDNPVALDTITEFVEHKFESNEQLLGPVDSPEAEEENYTEEEDEILSDGKEFAKQIKFQVKQFNPKKIKNKKQMIIEKQYLQQQENDLLMDFEQAKKPFQINEGRQTMQYVKQTVKLGETPTSELIMFHPVYSSLSCLYKMFLRLSLRYELFNIRLNRFFFNYFSFFDYRIYFTKYFFLLFFSFSIILTLYSWFI